MRLVIVLALVTSTLAVPRTSSRIVGGSDAIVEQHPFIVSMQFGTPQIGYHTLCGGTLITEASVLSAGHCYGSWLPVIFRVCPGTSYRSVCDIIHTISEFIFHPLFTGGLLYNDIVIARLHKPVVLSDTIKLARIAGPNYILPDGTSLTALGWGAIEFRGPSSEQLQQVSLDIINQELCTQRYAYLKTTNPDYENMPDVTDGMMCAGILNVGGKDVCGGDSGGPLAHDGNVIVGVTSWSYECGHSFYPAVFTRVSYYSDWIVKNT